MKRTIAAVLLVTLFASLAVAQDVAFFQERTPVPDRVFVKRIAPVGEHEGPMRMRFPGPPPGLPGMGAWWKNSEIAKDLNLTDAQRKQLEQTFLDYRMKLIDLNADLERQELKLEPLVNADSFDENAISTQLDQVIAARGRLEKSNAMMGFSMRKVLTQVQWKKLQSIHRERMPIPPWAPMAPGAPMKMRQPMTPPPAAPAAAPTPAPKEPN